MERQCDGRKATSSSLLPQADDDQQLIAGAAHSGLRGWRVSMEDAVVTELLTSALGVFAVLDGHGGKYCSRWCADELAQRLYTVPNDVDSASDGDEAWLVAQQL